MEDNNKPLALEVPVVVQKANGQVFSFTVSEYDSIRDVFLKKSKEAGFEIYAGDVVTIPTSIDLYEKLIKEHNTDSESKPF